MIDAPAPRDADRAAALAELVADTPEVVIDLDVIRVNIERAANAAHQAGVALRPHTKTHKLPQLAELQRAAGATGIQVAKLGEAELMVDSGFENIFIGFTIAGEAKLARLAALVQRARISVALDSLEGAKGLSNLAQTNGLTLPFVLELDTGLQRSGVIPGVEAVELAERAAALPGLELDGVFTHEGHIYRLGRTPEEREKLTWDACAAVLETAQELRRRGHTVPVVSVGSSATFRFAIRFPGITEVRPGTYIFNDRSQIAHGAATPADLGAVVISTVVGRPAPERLVIDAGSKTLSSDRLLVDDPPASFGGILGHEDWNVVRLSEEHGVVEIPAEATVRIGDRIAILPNHICPVMNLASVVSVVEQGVLVDRWPVAGRGLVQ